MLKNEKYLIGFDRFIDLDWLNQAYYLSKNGGDFPNQVDQIKDFLQDHISGKDSIRKTANLLSRVWFTDYLKLFFLKKKRLYLIISKTTNSFSFILECVYLFFLFLKK